MVAPSLAHADISPAFVIMSRALGAPAIRLGHAMNVSPVLHLEENGAHIIAFHHDQQGQANTDLVLSYFATEFLPGTSGIRRLVIDLSGVLSLNSASLGPLVQKLREIQDLEGQLALTGVTSPALKEIFALTRFDKVFPIYGSREEAIAAMRAAGTVNVKKSG